MTAPAIARLNAGITRDIPLAHAAGIELTAGSDGLLLAHAPLAANGNPHGSAFGGSLYVTALVAGYAQCVLWLEQADLEASVVIGQARAHYHQPVRDAIQARVEPVAAAAQARFANTLRRHGRSRIELTIGVDSARIRAFELHARFAAIAHRTTRRKRPDPCPTASSAGSPPGSHFTG